MGTRQSNASFRLVAIAVVLCCCMYRHTTLGAAVKWISPTSGDWTVKSNWNTSTVPDSTSDVIIDVPDAVNITINTNNTVSINSLSFGSVDGSYPCAVIYHSVWVLSPVAVANTVYVDFYGNLFVFADLNVDKIQNEGTIIVGNDAVITGDIVNDNNLEINNYNTTSFTASFTLFGDLNFTRSSHTYIDIQNGTDYDVITVYGNVNVQKYAALFFISPPQNISDVVEVIECDGNTTGMFDFTNKYLNRVLMKSYYYCDPNCTGFCTDGYGTQVCTSCPHNCANGGDSGAGYAVLVWPPDETCCIMGWTGDNCDIPDCPGEPDCGGRGSCDSIHYVNPRCICPDGWKLPSCEIPDCPGEPDCSAHGTCNITSSPFSCSCGPNWSGDICDVPDCPGEPDCSGQGTCRGDVNPPRCDCSKGWGGDECLDVVLGCPNDCSGNGDCNTTSGNCTCHQTWDGYDCSFGLCNSCVYGACVPNAQNINFCNCSTWWSGTACTIPSCFEDCNGKGNCTADTNPPSCVCTYPYTGSTCSDKETSDPNGDSNNDKKLNNTILWAAVGAVGVVAVASVAIGCFFISKKKSAMNSTLNSYHSTLREDSMDNKHDTINTITSVELETNQQND